VAAVDAAYEDGALRELTSADRADLSRRLTTIGTELDTGLTGGHQARELFITITAGASLLLIPWIAVLPILLPATRGVSDWREIWVGFDVVLAIVLAATAVLAFLKRQSVVLVAFITATLLVCDAWFDTMTSAPGWDRLISLGSTILELTLALILFNTARLFFHFTAHSSSTPDAGRISELFGRSAGALEGLPADLGRLSVFRIVKQHRSP
jgi:hypothetical protein